jgi:hypothetical protein
LLGYVGLGYLANLPSDLLGQETLLDEHRGQVELLALRAASHEGLSGAPHLEGLEEPPPLGEPAHGEVDGEEQASSWLTRFGHRGLLARVQGRVGAR